MDTDEKIYKTGKDVLIKQSRIGRDSFIDDDSIILQSEIGAKCDIEKRNLIRKAVIGDMTYTGADTSIMWANIGKFCCISRLVDIGGNEHNYHAFSMMPDYRFNNRMNGKLRKHPDESIITVGNDVWIGQGVSIVRKEGLTIGNGAVLGSGTVVTKSIPPYAIAVGIPAKVIKFRFSDDVIEKLLELRWWDWPSEKIIENWNVLSSNLDQENIELLMSKN